jgi:hypothetical protein
MDDKVEAQRIALPRSKNITVINSSPTPAGIDVAYSAQASQFGSG